MKGKSLPILLNIVTLMTLIAAEVRPQNSAESEFKRFEFGGQFTLLRRSDADTISETFSLNGFGSRHYNTTNLNELGLGGRVTFNLTKNIAVESEANFFRGIEPAATFPLTVSQPGGRKFQALFGPKVGIRKKKFGFFGKVRPGLIHLEKYNVVHQLFPPPGLAVIGGAESATFFNIDAGGVFEYYPSRRTVLRIDVGDTIIRYNRQEPKEINPSMTRHNLQTSIGFGFRF